MRYQGNNHCDWCDTGYLLNVLFIGIFVVLACSLVWAAFAILGDIFRGVKKFLPGWMKKPRRSQQETEAQLFCSSLIKCSEIFKQIQRQEK